MNGLSLTGHALIRKQQRGFREEDYDHMLAMGTALSDHEVIVTNKDADREIRRLKSEINRWERLRNRKIVIDGNEIVTAYPARRTQQKRAMRRARRRGSKL